MPNGTRLVSPWLISIWSIGMPSMVETTWAKVVSWPWPCAWLPVKTVTLPVGLTRMLAASYSPARAPSEPTTFEGAMPQASM